MLNKIDILNSLAIKLKEMGIERLSYQEILGNYKKNGGLYLGMCKISEV